MQWSSLLGWNACLGRSYNSGRVDLKYSLLVFALVRRCAASRRYCPWKEACNTSCSMNGSLDVEAQCWRWQAGGEVNAEELVCL